MELQMKKSKQSKNNPSKKHHFLPRHYLRGFVNSEDCFFIYDKQNDNILPKPLTPDAVFFENNLNTVTFPEGESSDFLENLYTEIENQSWATLDNIRNSSSKTPIQLFDKMHLFLFYYFYTGGYRVILSMLKNYQNYFLLKMIKISIILP